tara:strand:- start:55145 stop:56170 length:1026 start_codon:yes stop_codon:yes gene_type:complete
MWVVRAVRIEDLDGLLKLVQSATRGLTSLQLDHDRLLDRVEQSVFAFSRSAVSPRGEPYVLVLANDETGELVGTSTVYTKTGGYQPFYAYELTQSHHHSDMLGVDNERTYLQLQRIHDGPTEIGSLFLRGSYRGKGRGRWLSLARFALIAMRRNRFADRVIAEMRGRADADGRVPFWEAVTGRFIPVDFATADAMSTVSKQFIEEMMPMHPIYLDLLPQEVRDGIGQVHDETVPALQMLRSEGFQPTAQVDIFDAGPVIDCATNQINAVRRTREIVVAGTVDKSDDLDDQAILCSNKGGFTSVLTSIKTDVDGIVIGKDVAEHLELEIGSTCYALPPRQQD